MTGGLINRRLGQLSATTHPAPPGRTGRGVHQGGGREPTAEVEIPVILDLLDAACGAGCSVPRALAAVGAAVGGERGRALAQAATMVVLGEDWHRAWDAAPDVLAPVGRALGPSWLDGVAPTVALRAEAEVVRRERHSRALEAAARLGVRLVLPLGLCYLPAFVLVGLVPVLVSMAAATLAG